MFEHPVLDHSIIHGEAHSARVRVVHNAEIDENVLALQLLYPHEQVLQMRLGHAHTCIYTTTASAADVAAAVQHHQEQEQVRH